MMQFERGDSVRYTTDGRIGVVTGKVDNEKNRWQVKFNGVELIWVPGEKLEFVPDKEDPYDLFQDEKFLSIRDYRRCLYRYRLSGDLTNIIYSMDNAVTTFMPHQFIPVIKFLESYTNRLLIADEVGLGKTIEAMYIWEELRARKNAKRLLVVVPAVLRDKWKDDMKRFFDIDAEIVSPQRKDDTSSLEKRIEGIRQDYTKSKFALIVSIEGLRVAKAVRKIFEECKDVEYLFDLTIIDEAHYYRNKKRETFGTGELLRDVSQHLLLLSATPIQTSSENFFHLLQLLAPEDFEYRETFEYQLAENKPLVQLANALERHDDIETVSQYLNEAICNDVFSRDEDLNYLYKNLNRIVKDSHERVVMIKKIKDKYFYSSLVTRSRKRDVIPNRIQRSARSVNFKLSAYERKFYDDVTMYLKTENWKVDKPTTFSTFRLIMRQRQMASCIPAALAAWRGIGVTDDDLDEEKLNDEHAKQLLTNMPKFESYDLYRLKKEDSKYRRVLSEIRRIIALNSSEKIVVFTFFRTTARYLSERLREDNISTIHLMGGFNSEEKARRLEEFKDSLVNVLVSTEVGSEGIDLQFARYELNYDLPWNPMRLEQRIGRIDRIGQEADPIYICNAYCENTVEDRILQRLYARISLFKDVIGDIEEILGEKTEELARDIFRSGDLTEEELNARADQVMDAICHQQEMSKKLELESGIMASDYQQFVLDNIRNARESNRLLTAPELMFFCSDLLQEKYVGSFVSPIDGTSVADVKLSDNARRALLKFIESNPLVSATELGSMAAGVRCNFGKRCPETVKASAIREIIDVNHPLIRWLLYENEKSAVYASGCEIVSILKKDIPASCNIQSGYFAFGIMHWKTNGVKRVDELRYYFARGKYGESGDVKVLDGDIAERLLVSVMMHGKDYDVNLLESNDYNACGLALEAVSTRMDRDFYEFAENQEKKNKDLVFEQSKYVERTATAKAAKLQETIDKLHREGKEKGEKLHCGKLDKLREMRDMQLERIKDKLDCSPENQIVAIGILNVREV